MPTGPELITAIGASNQLINVPDCPAVSVKMSEAVYGVVQDDSGPNISIRPGSKQKQQINTSIKFDGTNSDTEITWTPIAREMGESQTPHT